MHLAELAGARVALLGLGRDVVAAARHVVAAGPASVVVVDDGHAPGTTVDVPGAGPLPVVDLATAATTCDVVVRSPGFPRYRPELVAARARGARSTTPLDLWMAQVDPARRVVAVTGTKGKSTTASMVAAMATEMGLDAVLGGNIGTPVFSPGWDTGAGVVVLEVSSYQAADLHHPPELAVLTSLSEDHLDWHGDRRRYVADKLRVLSNEGGRAQAVFVPAGDAAAVEAATGTGCDVELVAPPEWSDPSVPDHVVVDAALAAAVVARLQGADVAVLDVLTSSPGLRSRLEVVAEGAGFTWVDDALGSNPTATAAGLRWVRNQQRPAVVLLGGAERMVDPTPLRQEAAAWPPGRLWAVALPDNGVELAVRCGLDLAAVAAGVEQGVVAAAQLALPGSVILLSPGAPTPRAVGTWEERAADFRRAVAALVGP